MDSSSRDHSLRSARRSIPARVAGQALGAAAIALIVWGPAPVARTRVDVRAGGADLHAAAFAVVLDVRVPYSGEFELRLVGQCTQGPEARFRVQAGTHPHSLRAKVAAGDLPASVPLRRAGGERAFVTLPAGGFQVVVESDSPGSRFDALQLISTAGRGTLTFEGEQGRVRSGSGLIFLSPVASGGAMVGSLNSPAAREEVVQTFRASADGLDAVRVAVRPRMPSGRVRFELAKSGGAAAHFDRRFEIGDLSRVGEVATLRFAPLAASAGKEYELRVTVEPGGALELVAGDAGGVAEGELRHGAERLSSAIRFEPVYASPWMKLGLAGLLAAAIAVAWGLWSGRRWPWALLAPALLLPAYALYQRDYRWLHPAHFMADNYDLYALRLHDLLAGNTANAVECLRAFALSYPHAHNPGVPAALALLLFGGSSLQLAYVGLSALAALAAAALVLDLLRDAGAGEAVAFIAFALATTHFLFVRTAARTSTDMPGYLAVVAALWLGHRLLGDDRPALRSFAVLIALLTAGLFIRLSLLPLGPAIAAAGLLRVAFFAAPAGGRPHGAGGPVAGIRDALRSREAWSWLAVAVVPVVLFFGFSYTAGLGPSFAAASHKALMFADARTGPRLLACLANLLQAFPLLLLARPPRAWRLVPFDRWRPATLLGAIWIAASLAFILVSGAPFWNRHFLPALPGLLLVSLPALSTLEARHPLALRIGVAGVCLANLGLAAVNLIHELPFEHDWAWYVLT